MRSVLLIASVLFYDVFSLCLSASCDCDCLLVAICVLQMTLIRPKNRISRNEAAHSHLRASSVVLIFSLTPFTFCRVHSII